ncbi:MAG: hypothetical protein CM15mP47_5190 [Methanobacteriota archaeon]|nr:MAG: hypothetical protein CM15mP47_5190 [Euryarchaeota archaeon]
MKRVEDLLSDAVVCSIVIPKKSDVNIDRYRCERFPKDLTAKAPTFIKNGF